MKQLTEQQNHTCRRTCCRQETREAEGYSLTYTLWKFRGEGAFGTVFSVTVSAIKGTYSDEKNAYDITRNKRRAGKIFDLLVRNTVTPCTLIDVLEDIL